MSTNTWIAKLIFVLNGLKITLPFRVIPAFAGMTDGVMDFKFELRAFEFRNSRTNTLTFNENIIKWVSSLKKCSNRVESSSEETFFSLRTEQTLFCSQPTSAGNKIMPKSGVTCGEVLPWVLLALLLLIISCFIYAFYQDQSKPCVVRMVWAKQSSTNTLWYPIHIGIMVFSQWFYLIYKKIISYIISTYRCASLLPWA